ncbi:MAG: hypothetical protein U0790_01720 [Isosphaeraceae bacterium]
MRQDILDPDDGELFIRLHQALMLFVNKKRKIVKHNASSKEIVSLPFKQRLKVRDALVKDLGFIDAFVEENPYELGPDELEIVRSWKDLVAGEFYVLRFLKKHAIFLTTKEPIVAYGVVAVTEPLEDVIDIPLPFYCKTVLHPFKGRIVYDGLMQGYNVIIGRNMTRELNDSYNDAKERYGVVASLPWDPGSEKKEARKSSTKKTQRKKGPGILGRWRIAWMEEWDQDFLDEEVEGYIAFEKNGTGEFQFGYVQGQIDHREAERDGKPAVEFSWDGNDEMDRAQGRGWAVLNGEELEGRIFFHLGDDSAFRAVKKGR